MATQLLNHTDVDFYGPSGSLIASGILTLNNGTAPTQTEMQGCTYTSRAGTGSYVLSTGKTNAKMLTVIVTPVNATPGICAYATSAVASTGVFGLAAFTSSTGAAVETTGIQLHFFVFQRMNS